MRPIEFAEQTVVIAKHQPEYMTLPAHVFEGDSRGRIACCWQFRNDLNHFSKGIS